MMDKIQVLRLYKDLLRYGQQLQLTDKTYFYKRIKKEFKNNKSLSDPTKVSFNYQKGLSLLERQAVI
ncbi:PREDICTED: uncharacterized protein LOC108568096 [Nicrophorus vespilloides]|uniref:Uncharacterized protein LOC108568096 n=1 Tax=Nicrophorus vespilloides TaxID=110193 RepID=A0ABM1NCF8_NICVS|nr:PREDICTED: uncharacterized protein LOC108568096 [Nicrophorus vespilloides]